MSEPSDEREFNGRNQLYRVRIDIYPFCVRFLSFQLIIVDRLGKNQLPKDMNKNNKYVFRHFIILTFK